VADSDGLENLMAIQLSLFPQYVVLTHLDSPCPS